MIQNDKAIRVFVDTEFTDFLNTDLISIGLVSDTGEEFYAENLEFNKDLSSAWVQQNIYPTLDHDKFGMTRFHLSARVWQWLDDLPAEKVIITADYDTDFALLLDLLEDTHPKIYSTQNIWSLVYKWARGIATDPEFLSTNELVENFRNIYTCAFFDYLKTNNETQHVSICDARATRHAWNVAATYFNLN